MKTFSFLLVLLGVNLTPLPPSVTVAKVRGIDVYVYSMPSGDYEVVDSGKVVLTLTGGCDEVVNQSINKAVKSGADAVIVDMQNAGLVGTRWTAIRYKSKD